MQQRASFRVRPLDGGLNASRNPVLLQDGESPDLENVELDDNSIRNAGGAIKMGNRPAYRAALRTRVDPALSPLTVRKSGSNLQSVPVRGYGMIPYSRDQDIGGDFGEDSGGDFFLRRGKPFDLNVSFRIPEDQKLYGVFNPGDDAPASFATAQGEHNDALDDCFLIVQKGGNKLGALSWALGVVNAGSPSNSTIHQPIPQVPGEPNPLIAPFPQMPEERSTYALVFMWYDAAGWAQNSPGNMRYNLTSGQSATAGGASKTCTLALRAILIPHYVQPGESYHVSVSLKLDTGSPGIDGNDTVTWNDNGVFKVVVSDDAGNVRSYFYIGDGSSQSTNQLVAWKGPVDSAEYLCKYGIRYSDRQPVYLGLGYRFAPWQEAGHIPFGFDSMPLEKGGFRMVDTSTFLIPWASPLTVVSSGTQAVIPAAHRGLVGWGGGAGDRSPIGPGGSTYAAWAGLGLGTGAAHNTEALRGYRLVFTGDATASVKGGILNIVSYVDHATTPAFEIQNGGLMSYPAMSEVVLRAFRWNQRELVISEFRVYSEPRNYSDERVLWSLRTALELDDETEPDLDDLIACYPLDDGNGGTLRDLVRGRSGYLAPFMLPVDSGGARGSNRLFLSGEGEALTIDLSDNPIWLREHLNALRSGEGGFAVQMTVMIPEAVYALPKPDPDDATRFVAEMAGHLCEWALKDPDDSQLASQPRSLMRFGYRARMSNSSTLPYRSPMGFQLEVDTGSDQDDAALAPCVEPWTNFPTPTPLWAVDDTPWVGETVTFQFGIEPTANPDEYRCYIAGQPKPLLNPEDADTSDAELSWHNTVTIPAKDVERLVVTVGGAWSPGDLGYCELNSALVLDQVVVFGTTAPGKLSAVAGEAITDRSGKLLGPNALPPRELRARDLVGVLGTGLSTINITDGQVTVESPGQAPFFTGVPYGALATADSIAGTYLLVAGDTHVLREIETLRTVQEEFYRIASVASDGSTLTLEGPYNGQTRRNASARAFRAIAATSFSDDIYGRALSLGSGATFVPGTTLAADAVLSAELWANLAPVTGNWQVRVFSPLAHASGKDVEPYWTEGLKEPRRGPILGAFAMEDRLFCQAGSCLFEADDRWRTTRESDIEREWFAFRAREVGTDSILVPLAEDRIQFGDVAGPNDLLLTSNLMVGMTRIYDFEVYLEDTRGIRTVSWLGGMESNPTAGAGENDGEFKVNTWIRVSDGRPELVLGSMQDADGLGAPPVAGLYIAASREALRRGRKNHVRIAVGEDTFWVTTPRIWINGKEVTVDVNARESGFAGDQWIDLTHISRPNQELRLLLGVARAAYEEGSQNLPYTADEYSSVLFKPRHLTGFLHSLGGMLRSVVVGADTQANLASTLKGFDPNEIGYPTTFFKSFDCPLDEGIGHLVRDTAGDRSGIVHSKPCICLMADMDYTDEQATFAPFGPQLYVANGGRPAVFDPRFGAKHAGVLPPKTRASFEIERMPLWKPNVAMVDPVEAAADGAEEQILHYQTFGNNYLSQVFHKSMTWEQDDFFCFKGYVKLRTTAGRIPLYSARNSTKSGTMYVEVRDGKLAIGWFDSYLKKEVTVETTSAVFKSGSWHYVNVRKKWPQADELDGNFVPSLFADGQLIEQTLTAVTTAFVLGEIITVGGNTAIVTKAYSEDATASTQKLEYYMTTGTALGSGAATGSVAGAATSAAGNEAEPVNDLLVVRRFAKSATRETEWDAKTDGTTRNAVSFTTLSGPASTTATGRVTVSLGDIYTVDAAGTVTALEEVFHPDMLGMLFQFAAGPNAGILWRIAAYTSTVSVDLEEVDGTAFTTNGTADATDRDGAVFIGVGLKKSTDFDDSREPDDAVYDIRAFGSDLARNRTNGVEPFNGEFASFGWVVTATRNIFFTDPATDAIEIGTDDFAGAIYSATAPGGLEFDSGGDNFTVIDQDESPQNSTQPNEELELEQDTDGDANADALFWSQVHPINIFSDIRRIVVTFYDADQAVESNPSPELVVNPAAEDRSNPSDDARILLTNLPVSSARGDVRRRIYMSVAQGERPLFVAEIPDNTSSSFSIFVTESLLGQGSPVSYARNPPPRAALVATSQSSLWFGNLRDPLLQPDGVWQSLPYRPAEFPFSGFRVYATGANAPVRAMADLDGRMVIYKRNAIFLSQAQNGIFVDETVSRGAGSLNQGALASLDDRHFFVDDRGPHVLPTYGDPVYVGEMIEDFFKRDADLKATRDLQASVNSRRNQYVFLVRERGVRTPNLRFSIEYDSALTGAAAGQAPPAGFRFSRYRWPALTALASVQDRRGGQALLVGGTRSGYMVWLDRDETSLLMLGDGSPRYGSVTIPVSGTPAGARIPIALKDPLADVNVRDTAFSGPRGTVVRWQDAAGAEHEAEVLFATANALYLEEVPEVLAEDEAPLVFGAQRPRWRSKPFDAGAPEMEKELEWLDVTLTPQASGTLTLQTFKDRGATAIDARVVDLTQPYSRQDISVSARYIELLFSEPFAQAGTQFELVDLIGRFDVVEQS